MAHQQYSNMNPRRPAIEALERRRMFDAAVLAGHVTDAQAEVDAAISRLFGPLKAMSQPLPGVRPVGCQWDLFSVRMWADESLGKALR